MRKLLKPIRGTLPQLVVNDGLSQRVAPPTLGMILDDIENMGFTAENPMFINANAYAMLREKTRNAPVADIARAGRLVKKLVIGPAT